MLNDSNALDCSFVLGNDKDAGLLGVCVGV